VELALYAKVVIDLEEDREMTPRRLRIMTLGIGEEPEVAHPIVIPLT